MIERIRWLFVLLNVMMAALAPVEVTYDIAPGGARSAWMVVTATSFGVWSVLYYRAKGQGKLLEVAPFALIVVHALVAGDFGFVLGRWVILLFFHALYHPDRRRLLYLTVAHTLTGQLSAVAIGQPPENLGAWLTGPASILMMVYLMQAIARTLEHHQRLSHLNHALADVTSRLLAERDTTSLDDRIVAGARELAGEGSVATLWRLDGREACLVAGTGDGEPDLVRVHLDELPVGFPDASELEEPLVLDRAGLTELGGSMPIDDGMASSVALPIAGRGGRRFLVVMAPHLLGEELVESLRSFANQVSLAIDLSERERLLDGVVANSPDLILVVDRDGRVSFTSRVLTEWTGVPPEDIAGREVGALLRWPSTDRGFTTSDLRAGAVLAELALDQEGRTVAVEVEVTSRVLDDGSRVLNLRDVRERRELEAEIAHRAFHDTVTGLPNRARFLDRLVQASARERNDAVRSAVALIDLDDFKVVNDTLGHAAGDRFLVEVADRLERTIRRGDMAGRLGGDEFALLLDTVEDLDHAQTIVDRVLHGLRDPFDLDGRIVSVSASIGIALVEGEHPDEVLRNADAAMYAAKEMGKDRAAIFRPEMREELDLEHRVRFDLPTAIREEEFIVHYQPIMDLPGERPVGVEALVRWQHPELGMLFPDRFIRQAEETGLIVALGRWVLFEATREVASWPVTPGDDPPTVAVNISAVQLQDADLFDDVQTALIETGLDPAQLTLEITESALLQEEQVAFDVLSRLRGLGVRVAIDDFGTGYSSLSRLDELPVDIIKVDRSFVSAITGPGPRPGLAEAIIRLATTMEMDTVAEGVERPDQRAALLSWGCTHAQGWLWSAARSASELRPMTWHSEV